MRFWPLLWSALRRKRVRTFFTLLSIVIAFLLYGYLAAVRSASQAFFCSSGRRNSG